MNALPCYSAVLARYQRVRASSTIGGSGGHYLDNSLHGSALNPANGSVLIT
jgi:hypothetical protein